MVGENGIDWRIGVIDTGLDTMTGGRVLRLKKWVNGTFMVTYGDGLGNVNIRELLDFHRAHGRLATVTAVRPPARFGDLKLDGDDVLMFAEKPQTGAGWINGGFFVFEAGVFDYLDDDRSILERSPLEQLAADKQLRAFRHHGFWHPMDTLRDKQLLESLWSSGKHPGKYGRRSGLRRFLPGRTVLVTGHTGFKGGWLVIWLRCSARVSSGMPCRLRSRAYAGAPGWRKASLLSTGMSAIWTTCCRRSACSQPEVAISPPSPSCEFRMPTG